MKEYIVYVKGESDHFNTHKEAREYAIKLLQVGVTLIEIKEVDKNAS
jgi:hypothetical protein